MMQRRAVHMIHCIILGVIVGVTAALFLASVNLLIEWIWTIAPSRFNISGYSFLVGGIGGLIIGWIQKNVGDYPKTMHHTLAEFKQSGRVTYKGALWKNGITALLVLACGASLGPEAALVSIMGGMITWVGDRLKMTDPEREEIIYVGNAAMLSTIFHAPLISVSEAIEDDSQQEKTNIDKIWKVLYYATCAMFAFIMFRAINNLFPHEAVFSIKIPSIEWDTRVLIFIIPAVILGAIFAYFFEVTERLVNQLAVRISKPIVLSVIAGLLIGGAYILSPYLLFSGEHEILNFTEEAPAFTTTNLLLLGIGKCLLTNICFSFGWRGGKIFPLIFSSVAIAFSLANAFPYMPGLLIACVVATSCTIVIKQPLVVSALLLFLFPLQFFPVILLICYGVHGLNLKVSSQ